MKLRITITFIALCLVFLLRYFEASEWWYLPIGSWIFFVVVEGAYDFFIRK